METLQRTANRGSISTGYDIDNSVKLESNNSEFFQKSNSSAGNRQTWTYSTWIKITETGVNNYFLDAYNNSNTWFILGVADTGKIVFYDIISGTDYGKQTNRLLRDTSAWYHVVFVSDTTNGTAGDRYRLYINGVRETSFATDYGDPPEDYNGNVNDAIQHNIGRRTDGTTYFNGYLAETILVDGTALDPDSFGEFDSSGIWKPIEITDTSFTWGTNGLWLNYSNASSMGANSAGTGGYSVQNVNHSDQATDSPTNNFCTFNPLHTNYGDYIQGASTIKSTGNGWSSTISTIAPASGKWYVEFNFADTGPAGMIGVSPVQSSNNLVTGHYGGTSGDNGVSWYNYDGSIRNNAVGVATYATWGNSDIVAIALDLDNHKIYFAKNNTWQNSANPASGSNGISLLDTSSYFYIGASFYYNSPDYIYGNYGGFPGFTISSAATDGSGYGTFEYAPPSGYYALCTKNLAEYG